MNFEARTNIIRERLRLIVERHDLGTVLGKPWAEARRETRSTRSSGTAVEHAVAQRAEQRNLLAKRKRRELPLAEHGANAPAVLDDFARALVHHGAEAGEHFQLQKLRIFEPQAFREGFENRRLGLAADARHALADIDRGLLVLVEKARIEVDLAVGDRDEIGGNVGADVAGLRLGDRQRGQRTAAALRARASPRVRAGANECRRCRRDKPRVPAAGAAEAIAAGRRRRAWSDRRSPAVRRARAP